MKCDLHVHTAHSGMCTVPLLNRLCRESYTDPVATYHTLKRRGMDLVTVTDHDSIDAAEPLRRFPDFFLSQEISYVTPDGTALHVGVYDIGEPQHLALARRRGTSSGCWRISASGEFFFQSTTPSPRSPGAERRRISRCSTNVSPRSRFSMVKYLRRLTGRRRGWRRRRAKRR